LRSNLAHVHPLRPAPGPPPGTEPAGAEATERPWGLLRAAVDAVRAGLEREREAGSERSDAVPLLELVAAAVRDAVRGEHPPQGGPAASPLGRELLARLHSELLRAWRDAAAPAAPGDVLALLEAVERSRVALAPEAWEGFRNQLAGPDGLDLVVGVAHDLRSPLTSILFLAETLGRGRSGAVNELQQRQLRLIYSAALGLNSLASDVIELARGGERLLETDPEPFSLAELLESLHDLVRPIAEEKGLEFRYKLPHSDRRIGRPMVLSRVLLNLTTNALKFTDQGKVEILTSARGLSAVEFSVVDTGHGISAEALADLYQPFQQRRASRAQKGQHHFSGTGLGLAMCRRLVEAMGSELKCETKPGAGTRFHFKVDLPVAKHL
jgi:signal transduction histidine kinase